ncbi:MAG: phenylalanine--tRNA ligase subunit beta [Bacteroidetes bacterium]|nr:phenylalanine--tRNA ligase subunit beta [Bacteroidota bacterium]
MTISYRWLSEYLPHTVSPEKLSLILTSIGLEVESLEKFENFKGGLAGLVVGEVMEVQQHPNADKLKLTKVNIGKDQPLSIVCGASNVALGQKVVVAVIGTTIFPTTGDPITMKLAKIRGEQSEGMICAEDEIGISDDHGGIIVLDAAVKAGTLVADLYENHEDWIYEIGLTPNRMDAMSHYGVAKDVCAYLSYHESPVSAISPFVKKATKEKSVLPFKVSIQDAAGCARYSGLVIEGVTVKESPSWLKNKLQSIGVRSINNIVDITNYILHETGQPLHAFDAREIKDQHIIVKKYPAGTKFTTLDGVERNLTANDVMISDTEKPLCIAGVFGGLTSGVKITTTSIFLESAWFENVHIRKTSVHHGLRTDAATRFEKGVAIDGTVNVLERAAQLIQEVAGGKCSEVIDVYPAPAPKTKVTISFAYLKKLSGKVYPVEKVKTILTSLGFEILKETAEGLDLAVPYHKPDISIPADIVEEVVRIDGLDNIAIPSVISMSPAIDPLEKKEKFKDKIANYLVGRGFTEILTNSITNSAYFSEEVLASSVKMLNNLSADLDVMRPSMLETGLETIAYNINRKNTSIAFFEMGKVYGKSASAKYYESEQLAIYISGKQQQDGWRTKTMPADFFVAKGIATALCKLLGLATGQWKSEDGGQVTYIIHKKVVCTLDIIGTKKLQTFGIKQSVLYIQFDLSSLLALYQSHQVVYQEVSKYPSVERDIALVLPQATKYAAIEQSIAAVKIAALQESSVFDIFESEKLGDQKKSVAINFVFNAVDKTLTDVEIDAMMKKLVQEFEKNLQAEIRK